MRDWRAGECEPVPGVTMPALSVVERDYGAVADQWATLGPLLEMAGSSVEGASSIPDKEVRELGRRNGLVHGRPSLERPAGRRGDARALRGDQRTARRRRVRALEERCGVALADLAKPAAGTA